MRIELDGVVLAESEATVMVFETGLLTARSDWGKTPTWIAFQMGNHLKADHQSYVPGQLQIKRGADDLLINGHAPGQSRRRQGKVGVAALRGDQRGRSRSADAERHGG